MYADRLPEGGAEIWFRLGDDNFAYEAATNEMIDRAQYKILASELT